MQEELEDWEENLAAGTEKELKILGELPGQWRQLEAGWKSLAEGGESALQLEESGKVATLEQAAATIRKVQQSGLKTIAAQRQAANYQAAFGSWLDVQSRGEAAIAAKNRIAELLPLERELRENYERVAAEFDRQRNELGLMYQSLLQRTVRAKIAARTEKLLAVFGVFLSLMGVIIAYLQLRG